MTGGPLAFWVGVCYDGDPKKQNRDSRHIPLELYQDGGYMEIFTTKDLLF